MNKQENKRIPPDTFKELWDLSLRFLDTHKNPYSDEGVEFAVLNGVEFKDFEYVCKIVMKRQRSGFGYPLPPGYVQAFPDGKSHKKALQFCSEVRALAARYGLQFLVITDGASAINNKDNLAILKANVAFREWQKGNYEDTSRG